MPDTGSNHDMILGEMRGQLREVVHAMNNLSQNFTALTREVGGLGSLAVEVAELKTNYSSQDKRIAKLENELSHREGRDGVLYALMRSPVLGWIMGGVLAVWALLTDRLN